MPKQQALELERFLPYRLAVLSNRLSQAIARSYETRFQLSITEWRVLAVLGRYENYSIPRFLGPGAPRAGFVGIRVTL